MADNQPNKNKINTDKWTVSIAVLCVLAMFGTCMGRGPSTTGGVKEDKPAENPIGGVPIPQPEQGGLYYGTVSREDVPGGLSYMVVKGPNGEVYCEGYMQDRPAFEFMEDHDAKDGKVDNIVSFYQSHMPKKFCTYIYNLDGSVEVQDKYIVTNPEDGEIYEITWQGPVS